jgi:hypothetical protein
MIDLHPMRQKKRSRFLKFAVALCVMALALQTHAQNVSLDDFNALKNTVSNLVGEVQKLHQARDADAQTHQKDQEEIKQLREKLGETQKTAQDAQQKATAATEAAAAAPVKPILPGPIDEATVNHNFIIVGDAEFQFAKTFGHPGAPGTFLLGDFAPIFLYRGGDRVLFEAGFDFVMQNNAPSSSGATTTVNLSFAQLDYLLNDYATLAVGNILLPLGTYSLRSAGWLNKFPDDPMPRDLLPGSGVGAQLLGAVSLGQSGKMLNYAIYGVNGPSSADGTGNGGMLDLGGNVGLRSDNVVANLHGNPSGGGRLGLFIPCKPHYDFELGLSGQSGEWDNGGMHLWTAGVVDATLHLGSYFEARGEYIRSWYGSDDLGMIKPQGWWAQAGYKLAGLNLEFPGINNLELVGRFDISRDGLGTKTQRYSLGYIYYLSNTLLFEGDYEFRHGNDPNAHGDQVILQLSYGF